MGRTLAVHVADIGLIPASPAGVIFFFLATSGHPQELFPALYSGITPSRLRDLIGCQRSSQVCCI